MIEFATGLVSGLFLGWLLTVFSESYRQRLENSITAQRWWLQQDLMNAKKAMDELKTEVNFYSEKLDSGWRVWTKVRLTLNSGQIKKSRLKIMDLTCLCPNCEQLVPHDRQILERIENVKWTDGAKKAEDGRRSPARPKARRA
jgi:hypothetical protein